MKTYKFTFNYKRFISVLLTLSLVMSSMPAYTGKCLLAPPSSAGFINTPLHGTRKPIVPTDKFERFLSEAERLFIEYLSYSRFPYNKQVAVQFVESKKALIRGIKRLYVESLGHIRKKEADNRFEGMKKLERMVEKILKTDTFAVLNLMGRPGTGKSTVAAKIQSGFAGLHKDEILTVPVDGINNNDITLVNELIRYKGSINVPLNYLSDEQYRAFKKLSDAMHFPLIRNFDESFLDFYLVAEEREAESLGNIKFFRETTLRNHVRSFPRSAYVLNRPLRALSAEEYKEITGLAENMRLGGATMQKNSRSSFMDIYKKIERSEFIRAVKNRERTEHDIRLFIVEGTYSYQGEKIFDPHAERLMREKKEHLVRVLIDVDESIRLQRIRDRGRSDAEEMLVLDPVFDAVFSGSIDLEREHADIIIDNTEPTDLFQIKQTPSGVSVQFGVVLETLRTVRFQAVYGEEMHPDIYVLPHELFKEGRSYADIEMLCFWNYFIKGGKKISLVGTEKQKRRIKIIIEQSLYGPDPEQIEGISSELKNFFTNLIEYFAPRNSGGNILSFDEFVDFYVVNAGEKADIDVEKDGRSITVRIENTHTDTFKLQEKGKKPVMVGIDYRAMNVSGVPVSPDRQKALQDAARNVMAVTPMGSEDGYSSEGDNTNFIIWLGGTGIHVDPSPQSLVTLAQAGIDPNDIPYVLLTHAHADHDGGLIQKILMNQRIKLLTTKSIFKSFMIKARALVGKDFDIHHCVDWIELDENKTNEIMLTSGEKAYIDIRDNLHPVPTIGFVVSYRDKRFGYSGDTKYDPAEIKKWVEEGKMSERQARKLLYFFWDEQGTMNVDLLFHTAGVKPIHTSIDDLEALPEKAYKPLWLVNLSPERFNEISTLHAGHGFKKPQVFSTHVLIPADKTRTQEILKRTLGNVTLLDGFSLEEKMHILESGIQQTFDPGDPVIFEGDGADSMYIILSGTAEVIKGGDKVIDARGERHLIGGKREWVFSPGDCFGETALIENTLRSASVRASSCLTVLQVGRKEFINHIHEPSKQKTLSELRRVKYCIEKWIQRYSDNLMLGISDMRLNWLARNVSVKQYKKGEKVIKQGDKAEKAYIVMDGTIGVYLKGSEMPVAHMKAAGIIGEMALIDSLQNDRDPAVRITTCIAETDCTLLEINKDLFAELLHLYPGIDRGLRNEYRQRSLSLRAHRISPHKYMVDRPLKEIEPVRQRRMVNVLDVPMDELKKLSDEEKISFFLNDMFSEQEFLEADDFSEEFYEPDVYRQNLLLFIGRLQSLFDAVQVQRFYHAFVEVSVYQKVTKTKIVYRFARNKKGEMHQWDKDTEVQKITELPARPLNTLLINLESEKYQGVKGTPENVKTLQAYLEMYNENANVSLIDCQWQENNVDFIVKRIKREMPDMVCVSSTFGCLSELARLIGAIQKVPHKPLIVVGGLTATWSYEYLLEQYPGIICIQREGEEALSALVNSVYEKGLKNGRITDPGSLREIPNLIFLEDGRIRKNRYKTVDLRRAPHPSRRTQLERMKYAGFLLNSEGSRRGCQYNMCSFCTRTHGKARPLRVTRVIGDFEEYQQGEAGFIVYADEDFIPNDPAELDKFIERIEAVKENYRNEYFLEHGSEPADLSFYIAARARCIWKKGDPKGNVQRVRMLKRLKNIGLVKIFLGVESGSPVQLKKTYRKEADVEEMKRAHRLIVRLGIQVVDGFINFAPDITLTRLKENMRFINQMGLVHVKGLDEEPINPFKQFRAQVGSSLVNRYRRIGLIASDHDPDTLMHDIVYRTQTTRMIKDTGEQWDDSISLLEYALKGVIWHAEQSKEEMERAELFISLFNWIRGRGYRLLEELCEELTKHTKQTEKKIDAFFDRLKNLPMDKMLFECERSMFPHHDVYTDIKQYIVKLRFNERQALNFLQSFFKGQLPDNWDFHGIDKREYLGWIRDIARDITCQIMSDKELESAGENFSRILQQALKDRKKKLEQFMHSGWESYYSESMDAQKRGHHLRDLIEGSIAKHTEMIALLDKGEGSAVQASGTDFSIYHRVNLKQYFQYRHPDLSYPVQALIQAVDYFIKEQKITSFDKVFLYRDGTIRCEELREAGAGDIWEMIRQGCRHIFLAGYDPFNRGGSIDHNAFLRILETAEKGNKDIYGLRDDLSELHRIYAKENKKEFPDGSSLYFTTRTTDKNCYFDIFIAGKQVYKDAIRIKGTNIPAYMRYEKAGTVIGREGASQFVRTPQFVECIHNAVEHLLRAVPDQDIEQHREAIMIINALVGLLQHEHKETSGAWLDRLGEMVDESVLPLTVYLPDTDEGRRLAEKAPTVPVVFMHPFLYEHIWPGIMPHMEDILLVATPGILDDFPAMLAMIQNNEIRPDVVQLIYELFHNRVNLKAFIRNVDIDDVLPYTSSAMRVMPRKTPVMIIPPDHDMVTQFVSDKPHEFMFDDDGNIRFLLHPYTFRAWQKQKVVFPRVNTKMDWVLTYPTSSHRTLYVLGKDRNQKFIGKVHSIIWAGPSMRRLKPDSVQHSFRVSERIRKPIDAGTLPGRIKDNFGYLVEQGFSFIDPELYPEGIGVLYRTLSAYPAFSGDDKRFLIPTLGLHNNAINVPGNSAENPLTQLIDWNTRESNEDPVDFFIRTVVNPLYEILFYFMFEHGILIEPHGQNFFLEIDTAGRIYRLVLKDWQSTMVDLELRLAAGLSQSRKSIIKHLLGEEASRSTSLSIIFDHYWGNYLMRQLLDVLVERYHGGMDRTSFRQMLLKRFKDVFERYYNEYPESKKEFSDIALRHGQKPLTDKTNTVFFAASGAPLLRFTEYERRISALKKNPSLRKGKITVPVTKVVEPNTVIQRQQYLPDNLEIDFDRIQVYGRTVTSAGDLKRLPRGTSVSEVDCTVIFPENYKKGRQYDCVVVLSGKGSHPARLMDFPEKTGMKDTIFIYPNAVFPFGRRYIRFDEGDESEAQNVSAHVIRNIIAFFQNKKIISENIFIAGVADGGNLAQHMGALFPKLIKGIITVKTPFKKQAIPALFLNPEGFRDNIDSVLGDDIRNWIYTQLDKVQPDITPLPLPLRDGIAAVHMAENVIPFLLHLMPKGTTERERIFIRQFDLLVSALCYCRFQLEIKINDPDIRSDTHRLESVKWMDINTVEWLEKQTISLLEQAFTFFERQGTDTIPHRNIERLSSISK